MLNFLKCLWESLAKSQRHSWICPLPWYSSIVMVMLVPKKPEKSQWVGFRRSVGKKEIKKGLIQVTGHIDAMKDHWRYYFGSSSACHFLVLHVAYPPSNTLALFREAVNVFLLTPTRHQWSPVAFSHAAVPSHCLVPHRGAEERSRVAKGGTFSRNSWPRLSFYHWQSHLLLQMASCPRQPPAMTNARHGIQLETFGKIFSKV